MKKALIMLMAALGFASCQKNEIQVPVYVWAGWEDGATEETLRADFEDWKNHGVVGVCINCGYNTEHIALASQVAKELGLEYHAWIPTVTEGGQDSTWYTVNRLGQSSYDNPPYVPYYHTLDPRNANVKQHLMKKFAEVCEIPTVDYIQLDYIRYADVILARALWDKYGLVMDEEYPAADFCYCDDCVAAFKEQTGIDIKAVEDPSKVAEWAQFRCDNVTTLVNELVDMIHSKGKKVSADVFPGPKSYAVWMVRQEWDKWNLDAVFPMNYNDFYMEPASWVGKITKEEVDAVAGRFDVFSGLFICKDWQNKASVEDPENSGLLPSEIEEAVSTAMQAGATGICLFTPNDMTAEHWAALDKAIRKTY